MAQYLTDDDDNGPSQLKQSSRHKFTTIAVNVQIMSTSSISRYITTFFH